MRMVFEKPGGQLRFFPVIEAVARCHQQRSVLHECHARTVVLRVVFSGRVAICLRPQRVAVETSGVNRRCIRTGRAACVRQIDAAVLCEARIQNESMRPPRPATSGTPAISAAMLPSASRRSKRPARSVTGWPSGRAAHGCVSPSATTSTTAFSAELTDAMSEVAEDDGANTFHVRSRRLAPAAGGGTLRAPGRRRVEMILRRILALAAIVVTK